MSTRLPALRWAEKEGGTYRGLARAASDLHGRVLAAIGAHEVINPEAEMGAALGRRLAMPNMLEHLQLGDETSLAEISVLPTLAGKTTDTLNLRRHGVSLVAIRRGERVLAAVSDEEKIENGDVLVILGPSESVAKAADVLGRPE